MTAPTHIQDILTSLIRSALKKLNYLENLPSLDLSLDYSAASGFGDLSSNVALRLSRSLKRPAVEISDQVVCAIKKSLPEKKLTGLLEDVRAEGGFINFYLTNNYFYGQLQQILLKNKDFARVDLGKGRHLLVEFVSANPTGPLSVAHARQAVVGDVLGNIFTFLGFKVKREYYLNDEGNQINLLGDSVELRLKELKGEKIEFSENHYQGDYIYDIAKKIKSQKSKIKKFSEYAVRYILRIIKRELEDLGVEFDYWTSQKELRKSGKIEKALTFLKKKNFLYEQDGAVWFRSTQFSDDKDRVVIKSDGSYTYLAPDIAYHQDKYQRGFDYLLNIWGPDHHGYIRRLKAAVEALGKEPGSLSIIIVQLATIFREGKLIEMSTRKGQYITLRQVLDEVGVDATRFFFLMRRTSSHLNFDLETAKKQTPENPVYYIQYAYARISGILRRGGPLSLEGVDFSLLQEKEEMALIKKLWQFYPTIYICYKTVDPYMLGVYLQEVAESFHRFYDRHRVLVQDDKLSRARLGLIEATKIILSSGLKLLNVSAPEKM